MEAFRRDTREVMRRLSLSLKCAAGLGPPWLHEVARAGNVDIAYNLQPVANDRERSIVGSRT
jgi:hypothetical protein